MSVRFTRPPEDPQTWSTISMACEHYSGGRGVQVYFLFNEEPGAVVCRLELVRGNDPIRMVRVDADYGLTTVALLAIDAAVQKGLL